MTISQILGRLLLAVLALAAYVGSKQLRSGTDFERNAGPRASTSVAE